ncbi:MAG: hypothetical protein ACRYFX_15945 [Janthinobacterium lividum]
MARTKPGEDWAAGYNAQVLGILQAIQALQQPNIQVEGALLQSQLFWGTSMTEFGCKNCIGVGGKELQISTFLATLDDCESRVQHYFDRETLTICTSETARQRIMQWWDAQPAAYQGQFVQDKKSKEARTFMRSGF